MFKNSILIIAFVFNFSFYFIGFVFASIFFFSSFLHAQYLSLDTSFNAEIDSSDVVYTSLVQPDGTILIAGIFKQNGQPDKNLLKLLPDGKRDTSFQAIEANDIWSLGLLDNGDIIIGGTFGHVNGFQISALAKLKQNGVVIRVFTNRSLQRL